jgi:hypothetical protein
MYVTPHPKPADEIIAGCIAVWKNAWKNPSETIKDIEKAIKETKDLEWKKATTFAEDNGIETNTIRSNSAFALRDNARSNEALRKISNEYFDLTASCAEWYKNNFAIEEQIFIVEGFNILRYQTGQEYHAHYDGGTYEKRVISPILYLNDEYTGGEIEFVNQGVTIKPEAGMFLIFPANFAFRHIAHPVKTGTKYAIVTWLHDQP